MSIGQREIDNDNVHSDCDDNYYDYNEKDNSDYYDDDEKDNLHNMIMTMIMTMRRMINWLWLGDGWEDDLENYADDDEMDEADNLDNNADDGHVDNFVADFWYFLLAPSIY